MTGPASKQTSRELGLVRGLGGLVVGGAFVAHVLVAYGPWNERLSEAPLAMIVTAVLAAIVVALLAGISIGVRSRSERAGAGAILALLQLFWAVFAAMLGSTNPWVSTGKGVGILAGLVAAVVVTVAWWVEDWRVRKAKRPAP